MAKTSRKSTPKSPKSARERLKRGFQGGSNAPRSVREHPAGPRKAAEALRKAFSGPSTPWKTPTKGDDAQKPAKKQETEVQEAAPKDEGGTGGTE